MVERSKRRSRSKRVPEPLDWRALASGPALRGLTEVLATPADVSRDRAARRLALDAASELPQLTLRDALENPAPIKTPTVGVLTPQPFPPTDTKRPTVGVSPTVGESPTVGLSETTTQASQETTSTQTPTVGVLHAEPLLVETPTVGVSQDEEDAVLISRWIDSHGVLHDARRIQRVHIAQHSMTLGEERFYQAVWHARDTDGVVREGPSSKVFSMGYDRLARLVRLDEKSVRLLIPKLVTKQIMEVLAGEVSATRLGRTYRIFSYEEILERQKAANLRFVVKKGRAVEFVTPIDLNQPLSTGKSKTNKTPTVGVTPTDTVGVTPTDTVGVTPTPLVSVLDTLSSQTSSSAVAEALRLYGPADDDAVRAIFSNCRRNAPDATPEEIVHFIHEKGKVTRSGKILNPLAFLIVYVPKCFSGETLAAYRKQVQQARERDQVLSRELELQLAEGKRAQQAVLDDPCASEEDKLWARRFLADFPGG